MVNRYTQKSHPRIYRQWREVKSRCTKESFKILNPTYKDCSISKEWLTFQNFCHGYLQMSGSSRDWDIDKDILIKGNKIYSKETCCLIPHEINSLIMTNKHNRGNLPIGVSFRNINDLKKPYYSRCNINHKLVNLGYFETPELAFEAYKVAKESEIKRITNSYRFLINPKVYKILMSYEVNIND